MDNLPPSIRNYLERAEQLLDQGEHCGVFAIIVTADSEARKLGTPLNISSYIRPLQDKTYRLKMAYEMQEARNCNGDHSRAGIHAHFARIYGQNVGEELPEDILQMAAEWEQKKGESTRFS